MKIKKLKMQSGSTNYFKLSEGPEHIVLSACKESGDSLPGGDLLSIDSHGVLHFCEDINSEIGMSLQSVKDVLTIGDPE